MTRALSAVSEAVVSAAAGAADGEIVAAVAVAVAVFAVGELPGQRCPVVGVGKLPAKSAGWTGYREEDEFPDR